FSQPCAFTSRPKSRSRCGHLAGSIVEETCSAEWLPNTHKLIIRTPVTTFGLCWRCAVIAMNPEELQKALTAVETSINYGLRLIEISKLRRDDTWLIKYLALC
ncbi:unnamed protein product, partial [Soboliphyme baturini]|uniref:DUF3343 domain-containing protein n=1 Tax=Soboliphyme baturini TaxID=241478 RepID=A0A183IS00_9BILA